ncbi:Transthyretin-like family protein [Teladorsagia circumcincta]|uniref:Transthyretin-like family protein n=1 Tax=Teladorsagia circumcincta TaxID=45464 RepID=A0A2G9U5P7_TELCI|nr:Transthyretin-like family protein [Teladorsagia circumcincta]
MEDGPNGERCIVPLLDDCPEEQGKPRRPDPDDLLDQGYTNQDGEFQLQGATVETTPIDPILKIYHDCNDVTGFLGVSKPGSRKVKFSLPDKYITAGMVPRKTMDIGAINLEIEFLDEEREYIVD